MVYLRHAWDATNSNYGKGTIVLFYSFIWIQILWAVETVIAPKAGWECLYGDVGEYAELCIKNWVRQMNLFLIGFLLYADRGGIKVWNTAMVFVFFLFLTLLWLSAFKLLETASDAPSCDKTFGSLRFLMWLQIIWSALAMVFALVDDRMGGVVTEEETTPLRS